MKKTNTFLLFVLGLCLAMLSSCGEGTITPVPEPEPQAVKVAFENLAADGSATKGTTKLIFTLNPKIEGLTAADIKLDAKSTGAKMGALTVGEGGTYTLALSEISQMGEVIIKVARKGYDIAPNELKVNVYPLASEPPPVEPIKVAFEGLVANGSATETTTTLSFTFSPAVEGLRAEDITLSAGTTGAQKGAFRVAEAGGYTLALTGISAKGSVAVQVVLDGYVFAPDSKSVTVFYMQPDGPAPFLSPALVTAIEAQDYVRFFKNSDGQVSIESNEVLIKSVKKLDIRGQALTSLDGIGYFTELTELYCQENAFTLLEFPALTKLEQVYCKDNNQPLKVDVSKLTGLKDLVCSNSKVTEINLAGLTNLESLACSDNELTSLDLVGLTNLESLACSGNELTSLDLVGLTKLTTLSCSSNRLTALDITQIAQFQPTTWFQVGAQKDAQGGDQRITLSVTYDQWTAIGESSPSWKLWSTNKGVTVRLAEEP